MLRLPPLAYPRKFYFWKKIFLKGCQSVQGRGSIWAGLVLLSTPFHDTRGGVEVKK